MSHLPAPWWVAIIVTLLLGPWFLCEPNQAWHRDWSYFHHQAHVAIEAVWAGQPPDLNPWHCAGTDMAENPQGFTSSPLFVFPVLFGPALGMRLALLVFLAIGGAGMVWALQKHGLGRLGAIFGGLLWALSPFLTVHLSEGHVPFAGFALLPLILAMARHAAWVENQRRWFLWSWGLGAVMGAQLTFGGVYATSFAALLLILDGGWQSLRYRTGRPVKTVVLSGIGAALFGLPQLLPSTDLLLRFPRKPTTTDRLDVSLWFDALFSRTVGTQRMVGHPYDWPEYVIYPGVVVLVLALLGVGLVLTRWWRERLSLVRLGGPPVGLPGLPVVLLIVLGAWAMLGDVPLGLDGIRRALPVIGDLRVPSRFGIFLVCGLCVLAATTLDGAWTRWKKARIWVVGVGILAVLELWTLDIAWLRQAPTGGEVPRGKTEVPLTAGMWTDSPNRIAQAPGLRHVITNCYEPGPHFIPIAILKKEPTPFLVADPGSPMPDVVEFAPGKLVLGGPRPFSVVVAQSYRENWQSEGGRISPAPKGLMRVESSDGTTVTLSYSNPLRRLGFGAFLLAAALWVAVWLKARKTNVDSEPASPTT